MKTFLYIVFFSIFFYLPISANEDGGLTLVAVGEAELEKVKISISDPHLKSDFTLNENKSIKNMLGIVQNNFNFYRKYFLLDDFFNKKTDSTDIESFKKPKFEFWKKRKSSFVVQSQISKFNKSNIKFELAVYHIADSSLFYSEEYIIPFKSYRRTMHEISNDIYKKITGKESIFLSKIYFVSDKIGSRRKMIKELYSMDFDGRGIERLTYHKATVVSPAISYDKKKVLYSLISFKNGKQTVDLYMMDLSTRRSRVISDKPGINSGAVFLPGDKEILLTLSYTGNAEIFNMNLADKKLRKVTNHFSDDVDPSISVDGKLMTYLSGRPGKAMIYTLDPTGTEKDVKRISFVGKFNATPRFSPDGSTIAFSSWLDNRFDIFRINRDGTGLVRMTKDFGSNEDPTYSNDGEFIAFSSQRVLSRTEAIQNIYIMDKDGEILGPVTTDMGNCISPRWSK